MRINPTTSYLSLFPVLGVNDYRTGMVKRALGIAWAIERLDADEPTRRKLAEMLIEAISNTFSTVSLPDVAARVLWSAITQFYMPRNKNLCYVLKDIRKALSKARQSLTDVSRATIEAAHLLTDVDREYMRQYMTKIVDDGRGVELWHGGINSFRIVTNGFYYRLHGYHAYNLYNRFAAVRYDWHREEV